MIGSLRGVVDAHVHDAVLVNVNGVGYIVSVSVRTKMACRVGSDVHLFIYDHVREDARRLFGFESLDERGFFETLISISGVGPKVALLILSIGSLADIQRAVEKGDLDTLTSLPGIGTKTAKKIILELKGKMVETTETAPEDRDVIDALISLGYPSNRVRDVVRSLEPSEDTQERIRVALKHLSA